MSRKFSRGLLHRPVKDIADLDRPVVARAKQIQRSDTREGTYLVKRRRAAVEKEALNHI
jgi:hypothetical protein